MWRAENPGRYVSWHPLVDALEQVPTLGDTAGRKLCLDLLAGYLGLPLQVQIQGTTRIDLFAILLACQQHHRALPTLIDVIDELEPESRAARRVRRIFEDMSAEPLIPVLERERLLEVLSGNDCPHLAALCRRAVGPTVSALPASRPTVAEVVSYLEQLNAGPTGLPPLLVFIEYLAEHLGDHHCDQLREWNDRQAGLMCMAEEIVTLRTETSAADLENAHTAACLVVRLERDLLDAELYHMAHWCQMDPTGWRPRRGHDMTGSLQDIELAVAALVEEAESSWANDAETISIEFLLPLDLLNLPVDQFRLDIESELPLPLGIRYHVSTRSLDRARTRKWHREWRRRWSRVTNDGAALDVDDESKLWWKHGQPRHLRQLEAALSVNPNVVFLMLSAPPPTTRLLSPCELHVGLRNGIPVMLWPRVETTSRSFELAMQPLAEKLQALREQTRLLRGEAHGSPRPATHVGSRVALLWDDPDRPVEPVNLPTAPSDEEIP